MAHMATPLAKYRGARMNRAIFARSALASKRGSSSSSVRRGNSMETSPTKCERCSSIQAAMSCRHAWPMTESRSAPGTPPLIPLAA
eukprot:6671176-Pyramimonas_sp.AAC.1